MDIRAQFPALAGPDVFLDNAGGSQVPRCVADRMRDYLLESYVQLDGEYATSRRSTEAVERAHQFINVLMNGVGCGEVVLGPSTSALCAMLADCFARAPDPDRDEIVVCEAGHEANVAPWMRLADRGFTIRTWKLCRESHALRLDDLRELLGPRTRLLAFPHVSNLLGRFEDIAAITELAHAVGAQVIADGVAYAPHRAIDVAAWDVDFYVFSTYKVYGPHMAALFGKHQALAPLEGPNFFFIDRNDGPAKFELGGVCHEACGCVLGVWDYFCDLAGTPRTQRFERGVVESAYRVMTERELPLQDRLLAYLRGNHALRVFGPAESAADLRAPTISFVHRSHSSREIALSANGLGLGIRHGHFYAHRLTTALGLDPEDGVVRASMVHYNDLTEVERLIEFLETL